MSLAFNVIHVAEIDSTQDEAVRRLQSGTTPPFIVLADVQTKGRGRRGRVWESNAGNVFATTVLSLLKTDRSGDYAFIAALAIHDAASACIDTPEKLHLKWPNDLLLNGVKCAGLLLEAPEPGILLIGSGVNIAAAPEDRAKLHDAGAACTPRQFIDHYLAALTKWIEIYRGQGLKPVLDSWRDRAAGMGEAITVNLPNASESGVFTGIDDTGALILQDGSGKTRLIHAGDVFFSGLTRSA